MVTHCTGGNWYGGTADVDCATQLERLATDGKTSNHQFSSQKDHVYPPLIGVAHGSNGGGVAFSASGLQLAAIAHGHNHIAASRSARNETLSAYNSTVLVASIGVPPSSSKEHKLVR